MISLPTRSTRLLLNLSVALACQTLAPVGHAAGEPARAPAGALEEVVVTAQYRRQSLYEVPISLSTLDGDQLDRLLVANIDGLSGVTPGLSGWQQGLSTPIYALRGISTNSFGIGGESSLGVFVDDAYIGRINSTALRMPDVERVEVLKGPQGSLLGRNASAGAILYHTRLPRSERSLDLGLVAGDYRTRELRLTGNTDLLDQRLLLRATGFYREQRGDAKNLARDHHYVGGEDGEGLRLALSYGAAPFTADLSLGWQELDSGGLGYETLDPVLAAAGGVRPDPFDDELATDIRTSDRIESRDANLRLSWDRGGSWRLRSITAWHRNASPNSFDVDGSAVFLSSAAFGARDSETFSQEFRLTGEWRDVEWLAGASYFEEDISTRIELAYSDSNRLAGLPVSPADFGVPLPDFALCDPLSDFVFGPCRDRAEETAYHRGDYRSAGLYGDLSWRATERLTLSAGLRYSRDDKDFAYRSDPVTSVTTALNALRSAPLNPAGNILGYSSEDWIRLSEHWDDWQPRLALNLELTPAHSLYVNLARGYKAGGFEPAATPELSVYDPETVNSLDLGARGKLLNGRFSYDLAGYYYDNADYQVQVIANGIARTINSDGITGSGLDWELNGRLGERWLLRLQGAYTDASFKRGGEYGGNRTVLTPRHSAGLSLDYRGPVHSWGGLGLGWQSQYQSDIYYSVQNSPDARRDDLQLHHLRLSYFAPRQNWSLHLHGRNLFDKDYTIFQQDVGAGLVARRGMPRQLLVELEASF